VLLSKRGNTDGTHDARVPLPRKLYTRQKKNKMRLLEKGRRKKAPRASRALTVPKPNNQEMLAATKLRVLRRDNRRGRRPS
jgi:hypothetical protein